MSPRRWPAIGCAVALALSGCGSSASTQPAVSNSPVSPGSARPTGSGSALDESYQQRCAASLAHPSPQRASGKGSLREIRLRSPDSSHTLRSIFVYRPGGVPDSAQLPVVYVLHGLPGDPAEIWTKFDGAKRLDAQFAHGVQPYEVVTLDGRGSKHNDTEWADSADGADKVESFVLDVAIPAVEGTHRRDACHRAIAGFSMGGFGAMNLAQRHPDVFGQVASISGYFHLDDPDEVFGNDTALQRANTPDLQVARLTGVRVMLLEAAQENLQLVKGEANRFAHLLIAKKIPVVLDYAPGTHDGNYAIAQQPAVAAFFEAGWRPQG